MDVSNAYSNTVFVIISTPTDYDPQTNYLNINSAKSVIEVVIPINPNAIMSTKSTVPVGCTMHWTIKGKAWHW